MFSNRFNTRNDPLLEAAAAAMKDGDVRRQAEAFVNEQFGVYSRKAVVREELAAYDAALEEAYGALKEGVQLDELKKPTPETAFRVVDRANNRDEWSAKAANRLYSRYKKAYEPKEKKKEVKEGNDGNLANNYPPYDKVTRGDVIAGATGKDQMGGKKKAVKEGTAEAETSMSVTKDNKPSTPAQTNASTSGPSASDKAALASKIKAMREEEQIDELYGKGQIHKLRKGIRDEGQALSQEYGEGKYHNKRKRTPADHGKHGAYLKKARKVWDKSKRADALADAIAAKNLAKKKQDAAFAKNPRLKEETQIDEAAYSAKAARAGKDIGKPGKQFSKIAKSAAKRYGSEERGKKVAGAILARIRAKHMKEDMRIGDPAADEPLKKAGNPPLMSTADPKGLKTAFSAIDKAREDRSKADLNATMDKAVGRANMKEARIDEIVVQKSQMRPGETLGMAMNRLTGKTAIKGGANDPTSSKFKGPTSSSAAGQLAKSGISDMSSGSGAMRTMPSSLSGRSDADRTKAASSERGIRNVTPSGNIDVNKFNYPGGNRATSIPNTPEVGQYGSVVKTTPDINKRIPGSAEIRPQGFDNSKITIDSPKSGDSRQKTSTSAAPNSRMVAESVQIGDYKYRII